MAYSKKEVAHKIDLYTQPIIENLIRLYLYPSAFERFQWEKDIWSKFHRIQRIGWSNKRPKSDFIYKNSWQSHKDDTNNILQYVLNQKCVLEPKTDINKLDLCLILESYFGWLSDKLSKEDVIPLTDVLHELKTLGL